MEDLSTPPMEVEDVSLGEDDEMCQTILNPSNNLVPDDNDEWMQPVDAGTSNGTANATKRGTKKKRRVRTDKYKLQQKLNKRQKRQNMSAGQKGTERAEAKDRMEAYRNGMSDDQKETTRETNKLQKREQRTAQSDEQKETERAEAKERMEAYRNAQSEEQKESVKEVNKLEQRESRAKEDKRKQDKPKGSIRDDSELDGVKEYLAGDEERNGTMDATCFFCGAKGFKQELQGTDPDHFGGLCCCKGRVNGIIDYNLPPALEHLYVDVEDPLAKHFTAHTRTYNNGMAMSSLALEKGKRWQTRAHKMESMLTSSGQLLRRVGPLMNEDGTRPKCVQAYFYGPDEATYYRLKNFPNIPRAEPPHHL